jgi:hypothetical protein
MDAPDAVRAPTNGKWMKIGIGHFHRVPATTSRGASDWLAGSGDFVFDKETDCFL